ncbi:MAG: hypothetical protein EXQ47_09190 [Bryobacterales bacterium]|nr:hypothetical protein [Bryobacterales bacterium]
MAHNIKNTDVERLARVKANRGKLSREQRIDAALKRFREEFPSGDFGRRITKEEEEKILGFGPQ